MSRTLTRSPAADGFRMPAEWEPHAGTWMIWPERPDNWRLEAAPAQKAFAEIAKTIAETEPVIIGASPRQIRAARAALGETIRIVELNSDDAWMRDTGPSFITDARGCVRGIDWRFNAWGGLYAPYDQDEGVARSVLKIEMLDRYAADFVLEGGAIHVDGEGTLLTTEQCLLNPNRNPNLTRAEIETGLAGFLNISRVIWLGAGIVDDETGGHIDNLACFARPGVVLLTWTEDRSDPQYEISQDAFARLSKARDARDRPVEIVKLPQPRPLRMTVEEAAGLVPSGKTKIRRPGDRLAASYINFYIANGAVVMPLLDSETDAQAAEILAALFPDRRVKGVAAREILLGGGNIHCITQQRPVGRSG